MMAARMAVCLDWHAAHLICDMLGSTCCVHHIFSRAICLKSMYFKIICILKLFVF